MGRALEHSQRAEHMLVQLAEFRLDEALLADRMPGPQPQRPVPGMIVDSAQGRRAGLPGWQRRARLAEDPDLP